MEQCYYVFIVSKLLWQLKITVIVNRWVQNKKNHVHFMKIPLCLSYVPGVNEYKVLNEITKYELNVR